jgi:hypothetical protein
MNSPKNNLPPKPISKLSSDKIPIELQSLKQWVLFKLVWNGKKWSKVPYRLDGQKASVTDPTHWRFFNAVSSACELLDSGDGVGFVFSKDDPYCGIDLDHCVAPGTRQIEPWALRWIEKFSAAYIEFSPSGTGIHIITRGKLPGKGQREGGIEVYDRARYFTITGNEYSPLHGSIADQQDVLDALLRELSKEKVSVEVDATKQLSGKVLDENEIQEIIRKAKAAQNGEKFSRLFEGKWQKDYQSQSEADLAFCSILAFWTSENEAAIDQLFRKSGLYRDKWERIDYRTGTIRKAIELRRSNVANDFPSLEKVSAEVKPFPLIHISKIEEKHIEFLIDSLWVKNSVGFISAQPGTCKTWLAWDLAFSVATGTKALGTFQAQKGKVIAFNAEDDPSRITKQRLSGIANSRKLKLEDADFLLIDVPSLSLDEPEVQKRIEKTIADHKPALVILDPFRNVHALDEDKASEISKILNFLRYLNREYQCSIMLVCHDRKGSKWDNSRRASQTRGSNALEGWRDTAIYLDEKEEKLIQVTVYHRGAAAPEPFLFALDVKSDSNDKDKIESVSVYKVDAGSIVARKALTLEEEVKKLIPLRGPMDRNGIVAALGGQRQKVISAINALIARGELGEMKQPGSRSKVLRFPEPLGTGTSPVGSGSTPYKGGTENLPFGGPNG